MTKEEVLQKVNDYCNEKSYTGSTLTDGFKDKFVEHFVKANADASIDDEGILSSMKFALNTAFSSASEVITEKTKLFETKENGYKQQIADLNAKLAKVDDKQNAKPIEIPEEIKTQLAELQKFKETQSKQEKYKNIIKLAKEDIRQDLHGSFDEFVADYEVKTDVDDKEQAKKLVGKFQAIFKTSIGNIKPFQPQQTQKQDVEFLSSLPKVKVS